MKLIGLTGNIASGKSTVASMLVALGAEHLDADQLVHQLYEAGSEVTASIEATFGTSILTSSGAVNRQALGRIVFADPKAMRTLEQLVHPHTRRLIKARIEAVASKPDAPAAMVVEAIKLIESGNYRLMDEVWFVVAREAVQALRLVEQRGLSQEDASARLGAQPPIKERLHFADVIIENSGSLDTLNRQVRDAWTHLLGNGEGHARQGETRTTPETGDA